MKSISRIVAMDDYRIEDRDAHLKSHARWKLRVTGVSRVVASFDDCKEGGVFERQKR